MLATLGKLLAAGAVAKENPPAVPAALPAGWNLVFRAWVSKVNALGCQKSTLMKQEAASRCLTPDIQGLASKSKFMSRGPGVSA